MKDTDKATHLLEGAYAIRTAKDSVDYYREFAGLYDNEFAQRMGYVYHTMLADVFKQYPNEGPIADIGCGTGLVAQALQPITTQAPESTPESATVQATTATGEPPGKLTIDGIDISQEMLDAAKAKNLYRNLYKVNLKNGLDELPGSYGSVVSAGTFTFGHLGPELLYDLLQLGTVNTLYCIGVNSAFYKKQGFSVTLESMVDKGLITPPTTEVRKIYQQSEIADSDNSHAEDTATVLVYRQT